MSAYIVRRLVLIIPTLLIVTVLVFSVIRLIPGDVIDLMVAENADSAGMGETMDTAYVRELLGLDRPLWEQYLSWAGGVFRGDLGQSLWGERLVLDEIASRLPITVELGALALLIAVTFALIIGTYSAIRQDTIGDYVGRTIAVLAISVPSFWLGVLVFIYPSIWWNWIPPIQYTPFVDDPLRNLGQFVIPAIILGMIISGTTMRMTRTMMLEVLRQDYIRTAWAKGLRERVVVIRHSLKNALIPVVSMIGLLLPVLLGGTVVVEQIFVLPGMGRLMLGAIESRDYPVLSGINLLTASAVLFANLLVDVTYSWLDPRVQYR